MSNEPTISTKSKDTTEKVKLTAAAASTKAAAGQGSDSPPPKKKRTPQRKRDKELKIRFSEEELSVIKEKAGSQSVAEFMREYCLNGSEFEIQRQQRLTRKLPKIEPELFRLLVNAGNNLNQIARHMNEKTAAHLSVDYPAILIELTKVSILLQQIETRYSGKGGGDAG